MKTFIQRRSVIIFLLVFSYLAFASSARAATTLTAKLSWTPVTTNLNGAAITGVTYNVYRSAAKADGTQDLATRAKLNAAAISAATYSDSAPLDVTKTYFYDVTAVSSGGVEGAQSNTVKLDPKDSVPNAPGGATIQVTVTVTIP